MLEIERFRCESMRRGRTAIPRLTYPFRTRSGEPWGASCRAHRRRRCFRGTRAEDGGSPANDPGRIWAMTRSRMGLSFSLGCTETAWNRGSGVPETRIPARTVHTSVIPRDVGSSRNRAVIMTCTRARPERRRVSPERCYDAQEISTQRVMSPDRQSSDWTTLRMPRILP